MGRNTARLPVSAGKEEGGKGRKKGEKTDSGRALLAAGC